MPVQKLRDAVGDCPICQTKQYLWLNDVPLRAFCWGSEERLHQEASWLVPPPNNPYVPANYQLTQGQKDWQIGVDC